MGDQATRHLFESPQHHQKQARTGYAQSSSSDYIGTNNHDFGFGFGFGFSFSFDFGSSSSQRGSFSGHFSGSSSSAIEASSFGSSIRCETFKGLLDVDFSKNEIPGRMLL